MKKILLSLFSFGMGFCAMGQTNSYEISFDNAIHHEAVVKASFPQLANGPVTISMSRSSPGRYALHEFAKNVYGFKATDSKGNPLKVERPNPYQWTIPSHDGTINIEYILFANRGDGTYSQVDETHAHLNMPATFMFIASQRKRPINVVFDVRKDLNWKVATQLKDEGDHFYAPDLDYFMDSPTEISDYSMREFTVEGPNGPETIRFVLHHPGTDAEFDAYFEQVKKVVLAEKEVFGEFPQYDYGTYTFLGCYMPNATGDGMEHRNSTIVTAQRSLANGGMEHNIGTVSHEYFHSWNMERIRSQALEPFDYENADMSGELWFGEGFTQYYTNLNLVRAGVMTPMDYIHSLAGAFNYVWTSPALQFFNPIEMSYQAPFVDAATSVDPVNRENTFISYYSYGSVLGLALDLSLREKGLNLDDFMKLMWQRYGKPAHYYTLDDIQNTLGDYAGKEFGDDFFAHYIYKSEMPDYQHLLSLAGISLSQNPNVPYFGAMVGSDNNGASTILRNTPMGSPAYEAGLDEGDVITSVDGKPLESGTVFSDLIMQHKVGDVISLEYERFGNKHQTQVTLGKSPYYAIEAQEDLGNKPSKKELKLRKEWLKQG